MRTVPSSKSAPPAESATRTRVLNAATRLFSRNGYRGTSMDDVAKAAPVSKGTIYSHFQDKDALFRAVMSHIADGIRERVTNVAAAPGAFAERLRLVLDASVGTLFEIGLSSPYATELIEANVRLGDNAMQRMKRDLAEAIADLIERAVAAGEISLQHAALSAQEMAGVLTRSANGASASATSREELDRWLDALLSLLSAALRHGAAPQ